MEERVFSTNPRDYNRISCAACTTVVKVHHLRRHIQSHGLRFAVRFIPYLMPPLSCSMAAYKDLYGSEYQYVLCCWHRCGICDLEMLFDLDTLYAHVNTSHDVKIKDYVESFLDMAPPRPEPTVARSGSRVDADGAPVLSPAKRPAGGGWGPASKRAGGLDITPVVRAGNVKWPEVKRNVAKHNNGYVERVQDRDEEGYLISNDFADYIRTECQICSQHTPMTRLRMHTKAAHGITITEYKAQFGLILDPVEPVFHRCGLCSELIYLDSDAVAVHLKKGGHPRMTHKDYNDAYMVDSRTGRSYVTDQEKEERAEQRLLSGQVGVRGYRGGRYCGGSRVGRSSNTSSPVAARSATSSPDQARKMVPTRGRGYRGSRGRGVRGRGRPRGHKIVKLKKEDVSDDDEDEYSESENDTKGDYITSSSSSHGRRRRARMGQGAYDEGTYDKLLKLQFTADEESESEDDEWPELKTEEDWGESKGEANRKMKQEEDEAEPWNPEGTKIDNGEDDEVLFTEEGTEEESEENSNSASYGNLATKSLQLGPNKLEVIMLDSLHDVPDDVPEQEDNSNDGAIFNFNTFSTYNNSVVHGRTKSEDA
jgi:hypothetical protein